VTKRLSILSKTAGQPIYISATFKNTGSVPVKNLNVGFALYGPQSIGGYAYLLGPLDVGSSVSISNQKATETDGLPAGSYTLRMYFSDGQGVTPFGQYDVVDWTINITAAGGGATRQIGLEIWNKSANISKAVDATGTSDTPTVDAVVSNYILFKQPAGTALVSGDRVDLYYGEYGQSGTYVATAFANADGYWEINLWPNGMPMSEKGTQKRYFVMVNSRSYSDGIRLYVSPY
jgi:hypothetical protein